jgi:hypothetical protein
MSGCKRKTGLTLILALLASVQAFSQQISYSDSLAHSSYRNAIPKPELHYSVGSTFLFVPHMGTFTGFTFSPSLSLPLSPKWSVDGGIIAGRYFSPYWNSGSDIAMNGAFNDLSIYGSATYHINSQFIVYGTGMRQLYGTSPYNFLPKSSYSIGSSYNFGTFSIGVTLQMSEWNSGQNFLPFNDTHGVHPPF